MTADSDDGNALIQKLRQQSIDNQEKNNLYVQRKTFENSQVRKKCFVLFCFVFSIKNLLRYSE
jgi:hypothetical protein